MKLTEAHVVPEKCQRCPRLAELSRMSDEADAQQAEVFDLATGRYSAEDIRRIFSTVGFSVSAEDLEELIRAIPQAIAPHSERIMDTISDVQSYFEAAALGLEAGCEGVLRMRARDRLGYQVTATVCGSPRIRTWNDPGHAASVEFKKLD